MPSALEQLFLPAECLLCRGLLSFPDSDRLVCAVCRYRWRAVRPPWCERCGQPEPSFGQCRVCRDWPAALITVRSAVWLDEGAREAVHALKYGGLPRIAEDLADVLARVALPVGDRTMLVPIPLAPGRLRERGYNQSDCLAAALARRWRRPVARDLLVRVRDTASQTALTPAARQANVAGAFAVTPGRGPGVSRPGQTFVLVDDVFTTGATLAEAARALARAGALAVAGITFGRAVIPDFI